MLSAWTNLLFGSHITDEPTGMKSFRRGVLDGITLGADGAPAFEREKCVHCGGCLWNCGQSPDGVRSNIDFRAGAGGLHSAEN